jgi:hypothetical protein
MKATFVGFTTSANVAMGIECRSPNMVSFWRAGTHGSIRCLAIVLALGTATTSPASPVGSGAELTAVRAPQAILVSFDLHAENYEDLDQRLLRRGDVVVTWAIELRRQDRWGWFDRLWANATVRVFVRQLDADTFSISRSVNGQPAESGILVDRNTAHQWLTSFSGLPLFERFQLAPDAGHVVTIRAAVEGGGKTAVVTPTLARGRLSR